jgi:hypothetical protein
MIEGTPAITITLPIKKPGAPDTSLRTRSAPFPDSIPTLHRRLAVAIARDSATAVPLLRAQVHTEWAPCSVTQ